MNKKLALLTVFLVVLVDLLGFGIILPLLPFYAAEFQASPVVIGLLYSVYSFSQLVFSPIWGSFSDRIGRRPIMLLSTFGACMAYILFAFSRSLSVLFLSRILAGVMGGNISTAQAYVADVTTHEDRAKGMGLIGAAFGIGFTLGPALAGILLHFFPNNYSVPGFLAAALSLLSFFLVLFQLPETVDVSKAKDAGRIQRSSVFSRGFWTAIFNDHSKIIPLLFLSAVLLSLGQSSLYSAFPLLCKRAFSLSAERVGMLFGIMGLIAIFVQGGMIRVLVKRFGEKKLFLAGNFIMIAGLALIPFAKSVNALTFFLCLMGLGASLNGPTLTSLISKEADPSKMGSVLGSSQGLSALGRVIGPTWGGFLFSIAIPVPFLATAIVLLPTLWAGFRLRSA